MNGKTQFRSLLLPLFFFSSLPPFLILFGEVFGDDGIPLSFSLFPFLRGRRRKSNSLALDAPPLLFFSFFPYLGIRGRGIGRWPPADFPSFPSFFSSFVGWKRGNRMPKRISPFSSSFFFFPLFFYLCGRLKGLRAGRAIGRSPHLLCFFSFFFSLFLFPPPSPRVSYNRPMRRMMPLFSLFLYFSPFWS